MTPWMRELELRGATTVRDRVSQRVPGVITVPR